MLSPLKETQPISSPCLSWNKDMNLFVVVGYLSIGKKTWKVFKKVIWMKLAKSYIHHCQYLGFKGLYDAFKCIKPFNLISSALLLSLTQYGKSCSTYQSFVIVESSSSSNLILYVLFSSLFGGNYWKWSILYNLLIKCTSFSHKRLNLTFCVISRIFVIFS